MKLFKKDPECYKCYRAGWVINSIGNYVVCPVCKDNRAIRILKEFTFNTLVFLFHKASDSLSTVNWVSQDTLMWTRTYNVETKGHFETAEEPPFESYEEVFNSGNEVLQNKFAHKILASYLSGYSEALPNVETSLKTLLENQNYFEELYALAKETHNNATFGKDTVDTFYNRLQEIREEESKAKN